MLGTFFMLVAALGVLRMPDLLMRMHAATKAGTLGAGLLLGAVAAFYAEMSVTMRAGATIVFLLLTAPVAAHMIGRAAYVAGVGLWKGTLLDELRGQYGEQPPEPSTSASATREGHEERPGSPQSRPSR